MLLLLSQIGDSPFLPAYATGIFLAILMGMTVHEFAHNYVAHLMGDPGPSRNGRLTLNPSVHIYWPGFLMWFIIGFGTLGTAAINPRAMRNPRWGYLAAVAGGPFSNLLLAVVVALIMHLTGLTSVNPISSSGLMISLYIIGQMIVYFNLSLFVFNLLPFDPLDGWTIVFCLLPADLADSWARNRVYTQYAFFACLLLSFARLPGIPSPFGILVSEPVGWLLRFLNI